MAERAAHLVDHVFPDVPVRQWVLSLPHRLRYLLAWDHDLCRAVVGVFLRAVIGWLRRRARRNGIGGGRSGAVAIIQRFGGALNLNLHVHALVVDGVFAAGPGGLAFHPARRVSGDDVAEVVAVIARRIERLLQRRGRHLGAEEGGAADAWSDEAPVLAGLAGASLQGRATLGVNAGRAVRRYGGIPGTVVRRASAPGRARFGGFDLHAGIVARAGQRDRLEHLCRYALRPPLAEDRLHVDDRGDVWLRLRHRWSDGTTHLRFDPLELLERLAVLTPRPRANLVLYHGVLAPRARWRAAVVAYSGSFAAVPGRRGAPEASTAAREGRRHYLWAELMRRTFGLDVDACPACRGRLRLVALIEAPAAVARILRHLGIAADLPVPGPARAPPFRVAVDAQGSDESASVDVD